MSTKFTMDFLFFLITLLKFLLFLLTWPLALPWPLVWIVSEQG